MDPLTLSLIVAWAIVRALGETAWYGYQSVRQIPARRRRAIDVGYDPAAPETKPFTWERVFRRRAEGRHAAAAVCALGAMARGVLSLIGSPFTLARQAGEGWQAGWDEQRRRLAENEEWKAWWKDWKGWWLDRPAPEPGTTRRPRFRRPDPDAPVRPNRRPANTSRPRPSSDGSDAARPTVRGTVVDSRRPTPERPVTGERPARRRSGDRRPVYVPPAQRTTPRRPRPLIDLSITLDLQRDHPRRTHPGQLAGPAATGAAPTLVAVIDRPAPAPPAVTNETIPAAPAPALTEGDPDMSGQIATRSAGTATATRGGGTSAPAPVAVRHEDAKRIGEAIVKRVASRLQEIEALKDHIKSDMEWISSQIDDLEAAGIGGDLVANWCFALTDGEIVHQTAVKLTSDTVTMHGSARDALAAQRRAGDTMAAAKRQVGEENVAANKDYY
ncbi:hypothetical protein [Nonomuraea wenchangensis]|uniref:Uncharacterized protein n=1 Tax=Nonomuraea wenchangensis TaxID=568860 RepID=A0A1I0LV01_9ACTN|nr:hypothetical protein [Nonomuraea wenchangensis]SEU46703.1 hypothetical protein SAMN05421811_127125 [Nonomuraea wenchangensis]